MFSSQCSRGLGGINKKKTFGTGVAEMLRSDQKPNTTNVCSSHDTHLKCYGCQTPAKDLDFLL